MDEANRTALYLTYDGLTDPLGQSQILPYLIGLSKNYTITIVSFEKKERLAKGRSRIEIICNSNNLKWIPLQYHKTPPIFSTLYDLWILKKTTAVLFKKSPFKIIHCRSYITALVGLWAKRKFETKFIFDMRGFWADERVDGGLWNLTNPVYRSIYLFFKKQEKYFIAEADAVVSLTENAKNEILLWKLNNKSIEVIPCCVDLAHFNPGNLDTTRRDVLRMELGLKSEFVLLYLGSLGTWYLMKEMLDFFSNLKETTPDAKFLLVTFDQYNFDNYKYKHDVIIYPSNRDTVPLLISLAHASIIFIKPVFSKKASSATKLAEVLAMGVPVVTNAGWGDVSIYENNFSGFFVVHEPAEYPKAIKVLSKQKVNQSIRDNAIHYFSLSSGIKLYSNLYKSLM